MNAAACQNHPTREAIGICVRCRARICSECVTKVDGINYCVSCLGALAEEGGQRRREGSSATRPVLAGFAAFGYVLVLWLVAWGLLELALPGGL